MARELKDIKKDINELVDEYMSANQDSNIANTGWVLCYKGVDLENNDFFTGYVTETSHDLTIALGLVAGTTGRLTKRISDS